jgi:predicted esterase
VTRWLLAVAVLAASTAARADEPTVVAEAPPAAGAATAPAAASQPWCAPELETLAGDVCHVAVPPREGGRRTLVVFLHGVIQPDSGWQWMQQRGMAAAAKRSGFSAIMPRGRRGIGPKGMTDWWTWPTSTRAQLDVEADLVEEWQRARATLEARAGQPFDEMFVFGFSNGAYYATSLALRARFAADGFAAFAGGSAPRHLRDAARRTKTRKPLFVAIASKDKTTVKSARQLAQALAAAKWPHRAEALPVGHAIADKHLEHALEFLRGSRTAAGNTKAASASGPGGKAAP